MPVTFQGGQALPAVGTAAYQAAQQASGAGTFVPKTNTLNVSGANASLPNPAPATPSTSSPTTSAAIVTSQPATQNLSAIRSDVSNIQQGMAAQSANNQAQQAIPTMDGYNVSATPSNAPGVVTMKNNATGQTFYGTPVTPPTKPTPSATDLVTGDQTSNSSDTTNSTDGLQGKLDTENQNFQTQEQQILNESQAAYNDFKTSINQLISGTFPLTGAQQALVDSTSSSFDTMMQQAQAKGLALSSETGGVSNKISATLGEVTNIDAQKAAAIAKLEIGFQDQDYKLISDSYSQFKDLETQKTNALEKMHADVVDTIKTQIQQLNDQRTYNLDLEKFNQATTQFNQTNSLEQKKLAETTQKDLFDEHYKTEQLRMQNAGILDKDGNVITHPAVTLGTDGKPDPKSQANFLASLPPMTAQNVQGLANYTIDPNSYSSRASATSGAPSRATMVALAKMYDPTYNEANYQTIQKVNNDYTSGSTANNIKSFNTSINHIGELAQTFSKLGNTDITAYNSIQNWAKANLGSGDVTGVINDLNAVGGELAKTFKSSGATDTEIANIEKGLTVNSSPAQVKSFIETSLNLLGGRVNALNDSYTQATGGKSFSDTHGGQNLINPSAMQVLSAFKNGGYNIDVKGVNYTDPVAYAKASPDNAAKLTSVRSAHPELNATQAMQLINAQNQ